MTREVGLWIDYSKAVIVTVENEVEVVREIRSNLEKPVQLSKNTRSKPPMNTKGAIVQAVPDQKIGNHLGRYYEGVVSFIRDADSILIFGPGKAKVELKNRLERENLEERIVGIEIATKMTDHQIAAKVRDHFLR